MTGLKEPQATRTSGVLEGSFCESLNRWWGKVCVAADRTGTLEAIAADFEIEFGLYEHAVLNRRARCGKR